MPRKSIPNPAPLQTDHQADPPPSAFEPNPVPDGPLDPLTAVVIGPGPEPAPEPNPRKPRKPKAPPKLAAVGTAHLVPDPDDFTPHLNGFMHGINGITLELMPNGEVKVSNAGGTIVIPPTAIAYYKLAE